MYLLSEQEKELKKHIKELIEEGKIDEAIFAFLILVNVFSSTSKLSNFSLNNLVTSLV